MKISNTKNLTISKSKVFCGVHQIKDIEKANNLVKKVVFLTFVVSKRRQNLFYLTFVDFIIEDSVNFAYISNFGKLSCRLA